MKQQLQNIELAAKQELEKIQDSAELESLRVKFLGKKGELTADEEQMIAESGCCWGCDICQTVCPMNKKVIIDPAEVFLDGIETTARTDNISDRAYAWRGEKVIKRNLDIISGQ